MVHIKIDDLLKIAKQISSQYQMILREGKTEANIANLKELLKHEQFLYDFIPEKDYQKYFLELQKNFPMCNSSIYQNMCACSFSDFEKRVLWRISFLQDINSIKADSVYFSDSDYRFHYGCFFIFFIYLQNMYEVFIRDNPELSPYLYKSLYSLAYIYPYVENGTIFGDLNYKYFRKQDLENFLGIPNFSSIKDQGYLNSISIFIQGFQEVNSSIYQNTLSGNVTRLMMGLYFSTMLYMIDNAEIVHEIYNRFNMFKVFFSRETQIFLEQMLSNGYQLYLKRDYFLQVQEEYLKKRTP